MILFWNFQYISLKTLRHIHQKASCCCFNCLCHSSVNHCVLHCSLCDKNEWQLIIGCFWSGKLFQFECQKMQMNQATRPFKGIHFDSFSRSLISTRENEKKKGLKSSWIRLFSIFDIRCMDTMNFHLAKLCYVWNDLFALLNVTLENISVFQWHV